MRRLVWLVVLCALGWSVWWFLASQSLQVALRDWFSERRAEGWQAEVTDIEWSGYPFALDKTLVAPMLADPETGVAFSTAAIRMQAPAWWPGHQTVTLPGDEIVLSSPVDKLFAATTDAVARMRLRPGSALELDTLSLTSGPWQLSTPAGTLAAAQGLTLEVRQAADNALQYDIGLDAPDFQPGGIPRQTLRIPPDWPITFESLVLDATVQLDRPIDRTTIEVDRPQPRRIDIRLAQAQWADMLLRSVAGLDVAENGSLSGEVSLQARNWKDMLKLAQSAGSLPEALVPQLETILAALARSGGNPDAIDVTIALRDGTMFLGFIPLGPAPRLVLR